MKTRVRTKHKDNRHNDWQEGETGYVDGYCRGGDGVPYCAVVFSDRIQFIPNHVLEVLGITEVEFDAKRIL